MLTNSEGQQEITMPSSGTLNMLTKAWAGSDVGKMLYVTVRVRTTGAPLFMLAQGPEPTCSTPPSTRPYMEEVGWERTPPNYEYARWWSRQGFIRLGPEGSFSLTIPLTPDRWSGVSGQLATQNDAALRGFTSIVTASQPSRIGLVFGGGCSYGHGLSVSGGLATLTVAEFEAR